jgi:hypothetical protein
MERYQDRLAKQHCEQHHKRKEDMKWGKEKGVGLEKWLNNRLYNTAKRKEDMKWGKEKGVSLLEWLNNAMNKSAKHRQDIDRGKEKEVGLEWLNKTTNNSMKHWQDVNGGKEKGVKEKDFMMSPIQLLHEWGEVKLQVILIEHLELRMWIKKKLLTTLVLWMKNVC